MRLLAAAFLIVHGLIHLMGVAKAFRWAELPQLTMPISPVFGALWLVAAMLFLGAAGGLFIWPRWWWTLGAGAIVISMVAIASSWRDARFGTVPNVVALAVVGFGLLAQGPASLRAQYEDEVDRGLARHSIVTVVTEADLASLPAPVQRYLRRSGAAGQPGVRNLRAQMHGRIRSGPQARWMPFTAEQYNFYDEPSRLFYMDASLFLIPFQAFHRYVGDAASMRVKVAALVRVLDASGADMTAAETVTLFNDMCLLAPATLIRSGIAWDDVDPHRVRATFTNAGQTIHADLLFNDAGELVDFSSDDRRKVSSDGKTQTRVPWSTLSGSYRSFGAARLLGKGEAHWHETEGEYAYIEIELDDVQYNVSRR